MKYMDSHPTFVRYFCMGIFFLWIKINSCLNIVIIKLVSFCKFLYWFDIFLPALHSSVPHLACCRHTWSFGVSSWLSCVKCFDNVIYICLCCPWNSCINRDSCEICCTTRLEIHRKKCYYLFLIASSNWDTWWYVLEN